MGGGGGGIGTTQDFRPTSPYPTHPELAYPYFFTSPCCVPCYIFCQTILAPVILRMTSVRSTTLCADSMDFPAWFAPADYVLQGTTGTAIMTTCPCEGAHLRAPAENGILQCDVAVNVERIASDLEQGGGLRLCHSRAHLVEGVGRGQQHVHSHGGAVRDCTPVPEERKEVPPLGRLELGLERRLQVIDAAAGVRVTVLTLLRVVSPEDLFPALIHGGQGTELVVGLRKCPQLPNVQVGAHGTEQQVWEVGQAPHRHAAGQEPTFGIKKVRVHAHVRALPSHLKREEGGKGWAMVVTLMSSVHLHQPRSARAPPPMHPRWHSNGKASNLTSLTCTTKSPLSASFLP